MRCIYILIFMIGINFFMIKPSFAEEYIVSPGMSIQEAIDQASTGSTILVEKGQYNGNLSINKPIYLKGKNGAKITGNGKGNTIEINAPNVVVDNFIIEKSGKTGTDAGIWVDSSNSLIQNNSIKDVHYGIYVHKGSQTKMHKNQITSYDGHFSTRGNGIHLFYADQTEVVGNKIHSVQDGVYFDFATNTVLEGNTVEKSRYGYHLMYTKKGSLINNRTAENITGLMIMDTEDFDIKNNVITQNLDFRGHGILIFDSDRINILNNSVTFNNTGISLQDARDSVIMNNIFGGNYIGLDLKDKNERNTMTMNNFMGNIVPTKIFTSIEPMDMGGKGNYWDDYNGFDLNGDGIGEIPYESGKLFDKLVEETPMLQFFFESPSIKLWSSIERIFPAFSGEKGVDRYPLYEPVDLDRQTQSETGKVLNWFVVLMSAFMLSFSGFIIFQGRKLN